MTISSLIELFTTNPDAVIEHAERNLARALNPAGEGDKAFISIDAEKIRAQALMSRECYRSGNARPLEGITISIKDLFDVKGEVTAAGSKVLRTRTAASADAPTVARLREAGAILFGRANMTEFAFSGVGINPHYGTPRNIWGRRADGSGRIPGGSSSGGGVSVADEMCAASLGSDTGGSVRIPAALNGVFGFKPTAYRVPVVGSVPLSVMHDSMGPIANSIDDCARIDAVLTRERYEIQPLSLRGLRFLKPQSLIWDDLDPEVERATLAAIERLREAGATIVEAPLEVLDEAYKKVGIPVVSALTLDWHHEHVSTSGEGYDPRVWQRMQLGKEVTRAQLASAFAYRRFWIDRMNIALADCDAVICPTVACVAPEIAPLVDDDEEFFTANSRILRNTNWVNALDGCAATIPVHARGDAPVGLQIVGTHASDARTLSIAAAVQNTLQH